MHLLKFNFNFTLFLQSHILNTILSNQSPHYLISYCVNQITIKFIVQFTYPPIISIKTLMNPITYHDQQLFTHSINTHSNTSKMKKTNHKKSGLLKKETAHINKKPSSNGLQCYQQKQTNKKSHKQTTTKDLSIKSSKKLSYLSTPIKSPSKYSSRNNYPQNPLIQTLAQQTTLQVYIDELQNKNNQHLKTINLLQKQLNQKDALLDQCHSQISLIKQKFLQIFSIYNEQIKKLTIKGRQSSVHTKNQGNLKLTNQKIYEQSQQIMRRIEYSQDTLKLSQASSICGLNQSLGNHILQESTIQIPHLDQFQFFDTINNDSLDQNQTQDEKTRKRIPLQNIPNQSNFLKIKQNHPTTIDILSNKKNAKSSQIQVQPLNNQKTQNNDQTQAIGSRKQPLSAITATHRLAAFYNKKHH